MSTQILPCPAVTTPDPAAAPAPALPPLPSLADLIAFVETKPDLPPLRRRDLVSALRTAARLRLLFHTQWVREKVGSLWAYPHDMSI